MSVTPAEPLAGKAPNARLAPVRALRSLRRAALGVAVGFAATAAAVLAVSTALGYRAFTELSGSMEPTLRVGDVVLAARIPARDLRIGDVVMFRDPEGTGRVITHRVVELTGSGGRVAVRTRGDANTGVERWSIPAGGTVARVCLRIPRLGFAANRIGSRLGRLSLIVLPALLLGALELIRIWRPSRPES